MLLWEHAVLIEWAKLVGQRNSIWLLLLLLILFLFYSIFSECMCIRYWCINNWLQKSTCLGICFCPSSNFFWFSLAKMIRLQTKHFLETPIFFCSFFLCYSTLKQPVHFNLQTEWMVQGLKAGLEYKANVC